MKLWITGLRLLCACLIYLSSAYSYAEDFRDPVFAVPKDDARVIRVDLQAPTDAYVYQDEYVAYSGNYLFAYAGFCKSLTDPRRAACPTSPTTGDPTLVQMLFTERRTGLEVVLTAYARRTHDSLIGSPASFGMSDDAEAIGSLVVTRFDLWIPSNELKRIPVGGIWEGVADLDVRFRRTGGSAEISPPSAQVTWVANVALYVIDAANMQVYLPEFGDAQPLVDLDLRRAPVGSGPGSILSGRHVVDACLYDGFNAYSDRIEIRVDDLSGVASDAAQAFHVRHEQATGVAEGETIPFTVIAPNPSTGETVSFLPGVSLVTSAARSEGLRLVRLPHVPLPVVCAPWPITLLTENIDSSTKRSGRYVGKLRINFVPSVSQP